MASGCRLSYWLCTTPLTRVRWNHSKLCPHMPRKATSTVTSNWAVPWGSPSAVTALLLPSPASLYTQIRASRLPLSPTTMGSRARELKPEPPFVSLHLCSLSGALWRDEIPEQAQSHFRACRNYFLCTCAALIKEVEIQGGRPGHLEPTAPFQTAVIS